MLLACLLLVACNDERLEVGQAADIRDAEVELEGAIPPGAIQVDDGVIVLNPGDGSGAGDAGAFWPDAAEPSPDDVQDDACFELPQTARAMCAGSTAWQRRIAPTRQMGQLKTDASGNAYLLVSMFENGMVDGPSPPPQIGTGALSANVLRFTADGELDWRLIAGGPGAGSGTFGEALAVSEDRVCITGSGELPSSFPLVSNESSGSFIACADGSGEPLWARRITANNLIIDDIALDSSNRIYATGHFHGDISLGGAFSATGDATQTQQVLMSFEADGEPRWLRTLPGLDEYVLPRVLVLDDDRIAYAGQISGATEFAGLAIDDPFAGSGDGETMAALLVELDAEGTAHWASTWLADEHSAAFASIARASDNRIAVTLRSDWFFEGVQLYDRSGALVADNRAIGNSIWHTNAEPFVMSRPGGFLVGARCSPLDTNTGSCLFELDENLEAKNLHFYSPFDDSNTTVGLAVGTQNDAFIVTENDSSDGLDLRRITWP